MSQIETGLTRQQLRFEGRQVSPRCYAGVHHFPGVVQARLLAIHAPLRRGDHLRRRCLASALIGKVAIQIVRDNHFVLGVFQIGFRLLDADARKSSRRHQFGNTGQCLLSQFDSLVGWR